MPDTSEKSPKTEKKAPDIAADQFQSGKAGAQSIDSDSMAETRNLQDKKVRRLGKVEGRHGAE